MATDFQPTSVTLSVAATISSSNVNMNGKLAILGPDVLITNSGTTLAFVKFDVGSGTVATSADIPVLGGQRIIIKPPQDATYMAVIMTSGTATVYCTPGRSTF